MCVDSVNRFLNMEELLTAFTWINGSPQLILRACYHQVPLHPESCGLTACITNEGFMKEMFRFYRVSHVFFPKDDGVHTQGMQVHEL